ncbi:MAG: reverse transcriptase domain-containing protein [Planctomyces sp.]
MARSWTGLYPEVCSWQNLLLAYRRCRRRKRYAPDAAEFDYDWESRLLQLQSDLASESWFPGPYRHFHISDPKPRMISAASFSDRVVHHAVVNVLEPIFEPRFVFDSYACRRGKGTHRAIDRAQYYLRRHSWTLKTDIVKFFPNVDHELLMLRLQRSLRDVRLLTLLQRIPGVWCWICSGGCDLDGQVRGPRLLLDLIRAFLLQVCRKLVWRILSSVWLEDFAGVWSDFGCRPLNGYWTCQS